MKPAIFDKPLAMLYPLLSIVQWPNKASVCFDNGRNVYSLKITILMIICEPSGTNPTDKRIPVRIKSVP